MAEIETEITKYIRDAIEDLDDLSDIKTYLLGAVPNSQINERHYPLCQIIVVPQTEFESSITHWGQVYQGLISFATSQTTGYHTNDYVRINEDDNTIKPASFIAIQRWARAARNELRKSSRLNMDGLLVNGELVCYFEIGEIATGAGLEAERPNTWQNVSTIQFSVVTEKARE